MTQTQCTGTGTVPTSTDRHANGRRFCDECGNALWLKADGTLPKHNVTKTLNYKGSRAEHTAFWTAHQVSA